MENKGNMEEMKANELNRTEVIGSEQVKELSLILNKYKSGKSKTEQRIISSENWWKLRNTTEEEKGHSTGRGKFKSVSGWLHNVIVSKHADAMEGYPEPNILPRGAEDRNEAIKLSAIIPCVLEQNKFEKTYSDVSWQKLKFGTGAYKIVWDPTKLHGLGDISIEKVSLLNVFWEPGVTDIQKSKYFFHTELWDKDALISRYPELKDKLKGNTFVASKFQSDDSVTDENKATVIDVYYKKTVEGKETLQYIKYVGDTLLYASENNPETAKRGFYDHGKYPYVFDALYPIEDSPCGYGYVDVCRNPQTEIDLLKTSFVKNAMVGAIPRYFSKIEGNINEEEFLDLDKAVVHVSGNIDETTVRQINFNGLDGVYVNLLDRTIEELRETSGNTQTSTGSVNSGVTAASAIAALQEASGKGSRDSTKSAYRAYEELILLCIELIRQFYDMPRQFRILGEYGQEQYVTYTNAGIKPRYQGEEFGRDMGYQIPVFDIKISAQQKNVYTKVTQNELALQFFKMGFFNPKMTDQALMCLDLMEFDGKEIIMQKVAKQGTLFDKLVSYMKLTLSLAAKYEPKLVQGLSGDISEFLGGSALASSADITSAFREKGLGEENAVVEKARNKSNASATPQS